MRKLSADLFSARNKDYISSLSKTNKPIKTRKKSKTISRQDKTSLMYPSRSFSQKQHRDIPPHSILHQKHNQMRIELLYIDYSLESNPYKEECTILIDICENNFYKYSNSDHTNSELFLDCYYRGFCEYFEPETIETLSLHILNLENLSTKRLGRLHRFFKELKKIHTSWPKNIRMKWSPVIKNILELTKRTINQRRRSTSSIKNSIAIEKSEDFDLLEMAPEIQIDSVEDIFNLINSKSSSSVELFIETYSQYSNSILSNIDFADICDDSSIEDKQELIDYLAFKNNYFSTLFSLYISTSKISSSNLSKGIQDFLGFIGKTLTKCVKISNHQMGYELYLFTQQYCLTLLKKKLPKLSSKIESLQNLATKYDKYYKPNEHFTKILPTEYALWPVDKISTEYKRLVEIDSYADCFDELNIHTTFYNHKKMYKIGSCIRNYEIFCQKNLKDLLIPQTELQYIEYGDLEKSIEAL